MVVNTFEKNKFMWPRRMLNMHLGAKVFFVLGEKGASYSF
jgi:hypothetical protein